MQDIRDWLHKQEDWKQEIAKRFLDNGQLNDGDIDEIFKLMKTNEGQAKTKTRQFESLNVSHKSSEYLKLNSISDVRGIDNLASGQELKFGDGNLTVIYGSNGSGKSSYTRIIKKVSGKDAPQKLNYNIYDVQPAEQKCTFKFTTDNEKNPPKEITWDAEEDPLDALRPIDVFDSNVAENYLIRENEASYIPPTIRMFDHLVKSIDNIKKRLVTDRDALKPSLPTMSVEYKETEAFKIYSNISYDISDSDFSKITEFLEEDIEQLSSLNERLNTQDPKIYAEKLTIQKSHIIRLKEQINSGIKSYSKDNLTKINNLKKVAEDKRKIAEEAAPLSYSNLDGVGNATWRAMWEAARLYSQTPYFEKTFPVIEKGAKCLLCHQDIDTEAANRLKAFEDYVQDTLGKDARSAEELYENEIDNLFDIPNDDGISTLISASGIDEQNIKDSINSFWSLARKIKNNIGKKCEEGEDVKLPETSLITKFLDAEIENLIPRIAQFESDAKEFNRDTAIKQRNELLAKQWTAQQKQAIIDEKARKLKIQDIECLIAQTNTASISKKSGEISEKFITEAYIGRFNDELKKLGAENIKVELKKSIHKGSVQLKIILSKTDTHKHKLIEILSEGERRIVALAAFLADVTGKPQSVPFIFDDPISSLDHKFELNVSYRLCELAAERQVIVLTHRLSFLSTLGELSKKNGTKWYVKNPEEIHIKKFNGKSGNIIPKNIMTSKTINALNTLNDNLEKAYKVAAIGTKNQDIELFNSIAKGICSNFRILIERVIEDDLLFEVVKRHRRGIQTNKRLMALEHIKREHLEKLDKLMTDYSAFEHSQSEEIEIDIPEYDTLKADIEILNTLRQELHQLRTDNKFV